MNIKSDPGHYLTIDAIYGPAEIKEKGSRFIGYLYPVSTLEAVETILHQCRKKYYDATHVCFAFRLGRGKEEYFRYSDDGEPGGTAGLPIFNEIKGRDYFNVLAVVIRYYGGTKLGTGGLARAYAAAVRLVIDTAKTVTVTITKEVSLNFPFEKTGEIMNIIRLFSLDIVSQEYSGEGVAMKLAVPVTRLEEVTHTLTQTSKGQLTFE